MKKSTINSLLSLVSIAFISFILVITVDNNTLEKNSILKSVGGNEYLKEVFAGKEDEDDKDKDKDKEDKKEQELCKKLFDAETCEKMKEEKSVEKKELTEEEIKTESILSRYIEPVETEKDTSNSTVDQETEIASSTADLGNNTNITTTKSVDNSNISTTIENLKNLNEVQLVDLVSNKISETNNIDKNKVTLSLYDFIEPTKESGLDVIEPLKQIAEVILKDPTGTTAIKIIDVAKTK